MSNPNQDAIMTKIKKLLELAGNNPNEHERARAMEKAESMMAEYNLEISQLYKGDKDTSALGNYETDIPADDWRRFIGRAVAELYFCKLYIHVHYDFMTDKKSKVCAFVGTEINRQVAYEMALWLIATIMKESKDEFIGSSDQEDFCFGAAQIIEKRAIDLMEEKRREGMAAPTESKANALMVLRKDSSKANDDWYNKMFPGSGFARAVSTRHNAAAGAGKQFGQSVNLSRQVGAKAAPKRIG